MRANHSGRRSVFGFQHFAISERYIRVERRNPRAYFRDFLECVAETLRRRSTAIKYFVQIRVSDRRRINEGPPRIIRNSDVDDQCFRAKKTDFHGRSGQVRRSSASPRPPCDGTPSASSGHRPGKRQTRHDYIPQIGLHLSQP